VRYQIVPAQLNHVSMLADKLRRGDKLELTSVGMSPNRALFKAFRGSIIRRTAFVDGDIACMFGVGGSVLSGVGYPWLLTSEAIERVPFSFVREGRREVAKMQAMFPLLENYVLASYVQACGFLLILGFDLGPPVEFGPKRALFRRFELRR